MSLPLEVEVCNMCGTARWPPRVRCPICGQASTTLVNGSRGIVEQTTDVVNGRTIRLATIKLDQGPIVISRIGQGDIGDLMSVYLNDDGALEALPVAIDYR